MWKAAPEFSARVEQHLDAARDTIRKSGIAIGENRVVRKYADWERLEQIRIARAVAPQGDQQIGVVCRETLAKELGCDWAVESEQMDAEGVNAGKRILAALA